MPKSNIIAVIEDFTDWARPWRFLEAVMSHKSFTDADRIVVRSVWAEACSSMHWEGGDLTIGSHFASEALCTSAAWLSDIARSHLIRAASYEWR